MCIRDSLCGVRLMFYYSFFLSFLLFLCSFVYLCCYLLFIFVSSFLVIQSDLEKLRINLLLLFSLVNGSFAVSYTHLDVYKRQSPYLLFPCNMKSMLCNIKKNKEYSEKIPLSQLFHEVRSTNELYDDYGVKFMADNNKNMIIEIHFDEKYRKQDELIDEIARQISIFKHKNGIELSKYDKIVFEKIASAEANKDLRLNSF